MNLLNVDSTKASFVGICGMGGLGKTTIAKDVFNRIFRCFDGSSFINDVRENSKQGLVNLQNRLLSNIINEHPNVSIVDKGITVIKGRLHAKKVLIVLDDVDDKNQLESLAGEPDWFAPGSKIIITTRDESVLEGKGIRIYRPKEMDFTQSLVLFSKHAFRSDQPEEDFTDISKEIVRISGGLPLALQVLGSSLSDTRVQRDWESRLDSLKKSPDLDVKKKLEISYEVLGREEKAMFLDVSCFYIGQDKETAVVFWEGCGFSSRLRINVLINKSLVKIDEDNKLRMHDQLRDMGREIIRERSYHGPGTYSRLWDHEEALEVLEQDIGTTYVEGFALDFHRYRNKASSPTPWQEGYLNSENFATMSQLRLLQVDFAHLVGVFERFPRQLRWLSWRGCPLDFIPTNIQLGKLVVLDLSRSSIKQVWSDEHQNQMATKLKILNLAGCIYLTRTPDFSQHPDLERLDLYYCSGLVEIDKSIGNLKKTLKFLNLKYCSNLRELPSSLFTLEYVENLDLTGCSRLIKLPGEMGAMKSLRNLVLSGTAIEQLPDSIGNLKNLTMLSLEFCRSLKKLPNSLGKLESLRELVLSSSIVEEVPVSIGSLKNLEILRASSCMGLSVLPDSIGDLESLSCLALDGMPAHELPSSIGSLSKLKCLSLCSCQHLTKIPDSIGYARNLTILKVNGTIIKELPNSLGNLESLRELELNYTLIENIPDSIGDLESLLELRLDDTPILNLPHSIGSLLKLRVLSLNRCQSLSEIPDSVGDLEKLEELTIRSCKKLVKLPNSMGRLKQLKKFNMWATGIVKFPEDFGMLHSLKTLEMDGCQEFRGFPENFGSLARLKVLNVRHNSKLTGLPNSFSSLQSLKEVHASRCNLLDGGIPSDLGRLSSLVTLKLGHNNFCSLPDSINDLSKLKYLYLPNCRKLEYLPELPSGLCKLDVGNCISLERLPNLSNLKYLEELTLANCEKLKEIEGIDSLESLKELSMIGCNMNRNTWRNIFVQGGFKHLLNFSFPGSQIPTWFTTHQELTFVKKEYFDQRLFCFTPRELTCVADGDKLDWLVLCIVLALVEDVVDEDIYQNDESPFLPDVSVKIKWKGQKIRGIPKTHQDQVFMLFYKPGSFRSEEGSQIKVSIESKPRIQVKNVGVHLVYKNTDGASHSVSTLHKILLCCWRQGREEDPVCTIC